MVEFEQDVNDLTKFWYCTLSLMLVGDDKIDGDTILFFKGSVCPKGCYTGGERARFVRLVV